MNPGNERRDGEDLRSAGVRRRPPMLRAMGEAEPPPRICVEGEMFEFVSLYKHDAWAATSLYANSAGRQLVCKINRLSPMCGLPMAWLGRWLARRELYFFDRLRDVTGVPRGYAVGLPDGTRMATAAAHDFVLGHSLSQLTEVPPEFFIRLRALLDELHRRGVAYVDLHKHENILVGDDGLPYLVDFQISAAVPRVWGVRWFWRILVDSDLYHWEKISRRWGVTNWGKVEVPRPWWIRLHRLIANPFRRVRRRILVWLGIRSGDGRARTELGCEVGLRQLP